MLHTKVKGDGPSVVLLHSSGMSSRQWSALAALLAVRYHVMTPDLIGYGDNPMLDEQAAYALDDEATAVLELMDGDRVHLVGHSFGGLVALLVARRAPAQVQSLSLYDPVAFGVLADAGDAAGLASLCGLGDDPRFTDAAHGGDEAWMRLFVDFWNGGPTWDGLPQTTRATFMRTGRKTFREVMQVTRDRTPMSAYADITAPALLLTGAHTPIAAQRTVALLARALPSARMQTVPHTGHMGPIVAAATVNAAIAAHIDAQG